MNEEFKTTTVKKWGHSFVLLVPKEIRKYLGIEHGDLVGFRKCGRLVVMKRIRGSEAMPLTESEARQETVAAGD